MTGIDERLERDIQLIVQVNPPRSYSEFCEALIVYDGARVIEVVNKLVQAGKLEMTEQGFRATGVNGSAHVECVEQDEPFDPGMNDSAGRVMESSSAPARPPQAAQEVAKVGVPSAAMACTSAAPAEPERNMEESYKPGTILASTPICALGLERELLVVTNRMGIYAVSDLLVVLRKLLGHLGRASLALAMEVLVRLSGAPAVKLLEEDQELLCRVSNSTAFYFDSFGVLCTSLPEGSTAAQISEYIKSGGLNPQEIARPSLEAQEKKFPQEVVQAVRSLRKALTKLGYPVGGDSFSMIMLKALEVDYSFGECETREECEKRGLEFLLQCPQLVDACFGQLRDEVVRMKETDKDFAKKGVLELPQGRCFAEAADRLCQYVPQVTFEATRDELIDRGDR